MVLHGFRRIRFAVGDCQRYRRHQNLPNRGTSIVPFAVAPRHQLLGAGDVRLGQLPSLHDFDSGYVLRRSVELTAKSGHVEQCKLCGSLERISSAG